MDSDILVKALDALKSSDGRPAIARRRKELDVLVNALSNDEIRHLQTRLNAFKLHKDICASLPVELLVQVARYVELEDILRFRSVSRAWYESFNSVDFCVEIAKDHFPLLPSTQKPPTLASESGPTSDTRKAVNKTILQRVRLLNGKYSSRAVHGYDISGGLIDHFSPPQYSTGKFAYQDLLYGIRVKCLRTGGTDSYMQVQRTTLQLWCLSDRYLIMCSESRGRASLWAHTLISNDEQVNASPPSPLNTSTTRVESSLQSCTHTVSLPMIPKWITSLGDLAGITTTLNKVYLWRVGGSLKELPSPKSESIELENVTSFTLVAFLPGYIGFAIVRLYRISDRPTSSLHHIVIDLYENEDVFTSYEIRIPDDKCPIRAPQHTITGECLTWRLASSNATLPQTTGLNEAGEATQAVEFLSFDVVKKCFSFQRYVTPRTFRFQSLELYPIMSYHLWRERLLFPLVHGDDRYPFNVFQSINVERPLVIGAAPCKDGYTGSHESRTSIKWVWKADYELVEASLRLVTSNGDETNAVDHRRIFKTMLLGDDDFTILLGRQDGVIVWCHDRTTTAPEVQS